MSSVKQFKEALQPNAATILTTGGRVIAGTGSPLTAVSGWVGDVYLRRDGSTGTILYVKESGANTTDGWAALTATSGGGGGSGGSDGALVLVESKTASASASLDFTTCFTSTYDDYEFHIVNVRPATHDTELRLTFSTNGGSSYDTSAIYDHSFHYVSTTAATATGAATAGVSHSLGANISNASTGGLSGVLRLYDPLSATAHKAAEGILNFGHSGVGRINFTRAYLYKNASPVNAARFAMASGDIASGTIRCYGVAKTTPAVASGVIVQVKNVQTGTLATGTGAMELDNTIPQNTEGNEYMTLAITPTSATNILKIDVVGHWATNAVVWVIAGLFQDSTANALASSMALVESSGDNANLVFTHYMVAGTTSPTTFKVRAGRASYAGTVTTFNGSGAAGFLGGTMASSITITEIVP